MLQSQEELETLRARVIVLEDFLDEIARLAVTSSSTAGVCMFLEIHMENAKQITRDLKQFLVTKNEGKR